MTMSESHLMDPVVRDGLEPPNYEYACASCGRHIRITVSPYQIEVLQAGSANVPHWAATNPGVPTMGFSKGDESWMSGLGISAS